LEIGPRWGGDRTQSSIGREEEGRVIGNVRERETQK